MANRLINEQSPYLLQHANNPVDWYPWGDEAFEVAKAGNKPVLVSIGYAACHWCHVMEHESFEDEGVAAFMNEHFVCIKVDREEHPDVDHLYMDAVQAISGSGGWPLNVFVTPERTPFYGGTYFPPRQAYSRPSWMQVLGRMDTIWKEQHDEVIAQASQMLQHLRQASMRVSAKAATGIDSGLCRQIMESLLAQADKDKGGFGNAPKFPGTMAISYLIEYYHFTGHQPALDQALVSLDAMIAGGIYDQLGGGFARYATDRNWLIPHFEKMLYDNALIIISLCDAWRITGNEKYRTVIHDTIAFAERELKHPSGGYYCALDADSEGVEGKFYTWTWEEWLATARDVDGIAAQHFGVLPGGNWEHTNILHIAQSVEDVAAARGMAAEAVTDVINTVKQNLFAARKDRIRPITDDKCLLSWNALMNMALSKAGMVLSDPAYVALAAAHAQWMTGAFDAGKELLHTWKNGVARIPAKLDDYAYFIQALLQLASASGNDAHILAAARYTDIVVNTFSCDDGFFYYTPEGQHDIPVRKVDLYDGATPSANSVMAHNLWLCGMCMEKTDWIYRSERMLELMGDTAGRYAYSFGYWGILLQRKNKGGKTVVCSGSESAAAHAELCAKSVPQAYFLTCEKEISEVPILRKKYFDGNLSIFVCSEQACLPPVTGVNEAFNLINQ
jgi:uncharacterized protein YyaL (SSP411 family)